MQVWTVDALARFQKLSPTDRYHATWWLLASTGMRRGEVLGLRWSDVHLDARRLEIRRTLITTDVQRKGEPGMAWGTPKTAKGRRSVALEEGTVTTLKAHKARQAAERLAVGAGYQDGDLMRLPARWSARAPEDALVALRAACEEAQGAEDPTA